MKDTLLYIVQAIVDHPEEASVEEVQDQDKTILTVHTHPEDMGKIIGKSGRIIKAVRDLVKLLAVKRNLYVDVVLAEQSPEAQ